MSIIDESGAAEPMNSQTDVAQFFSRLYKTIEESDSQQQLDSCYDELLRVLNSSYDLKWAQKFGSAADEMQMFVVEKYGRAAQMLNRKAGELDLKARYPESPANQPRNIHGGRIDPIVVE